MKSFKMKALAVAVLGLAGAGSAMATCTNTTPFAAWSSWNGTSNSGAQFGGSTTGTSGLNNTACAMAATTTASPGSNGAQAVVFDNSPQSEQTYRFRFYIDPSLVRTSLSSFNSTYIFQASSASNHGTVAATNRLVGLQMVGDGTNAILRPFAACTTAGTGATKNGNLCQGGQVTIPASATGTRIEGQLIIGAAGTGILNIWVGTNVATPDVVVNVDNAAWGTASTDGVKQALMGILHTTQGYRTANVNKNVVFDEFDSRRQTAIGP